MVLVIRRQPMKISTRHQKLYNWYNDVQCVETVFICES